MVGESDEWAGYVKSDPIKPSDISATVFHAAGIPLHSEVRDLQDRPNAITEGSVIRKAYTG